ncbi:MAG TPA: RelA/SpoT domain-containing protein [Candidatus Acidoferrum sp.]|nr:RelA/SpoT domain-containing protein [Candidatus Acidoferrum sp.]
MRDFTQAEREAINAIVEHFKSQQSLVGQFLENVNLMFTGSEQLMSLVHSVKRRVKDPEHLRDKLTRKVVKMEAANQPFDITTDNLYSRITDLAGYRILHLHTRQMEAINREILRLIDEMQYPLIEGPKARIWDEESKSYFEGIGIATVVSPNMYSSVHYVIEASSKTKFRCEIQVRTLAEEVWGEVDHSFNYPHVTDSVACHEQIRVLARVASSCSRLVDSIFMSYEDFKDARARSALLEAERAANEAASQPPGNA